MMTFFSLGGNSLLAIQLLHELNLRFNSKLGVDWIFRHRTIAEQAEILSGVSSAVDSHQPIIHLSGDQSGVPLFMCHGAGADMNVFENITRHLSPDICCYGIRSYHLSHDDFKESIETLSSYYLTEMKPFLKRSGVVLAGWSFGGSVALEIAHLLELEGIKVHALFFAGFFCPN